MEKCRLCLKQRKRTRLIFDLEDGTTFVSMISSIANVKIRSDDGFPDRICLLCSKKLRECYEFKLCVERCDTVLHETANMKRISFNNLKDIKVEIEIPDLKPTLPSIDLYSEKLSKHGKKSIYYNNTVIKKVKRDHDDDEKKPLPVIEFLKTLKNEPSSHFEEDPDNDYDYDYDIGIDGMDSGSDPEFLPPKDLRSPKRKIGKYKTKPSFCNERKLENSISEEFCEGIKPVILDDVRPLTPETNINNSYKCKVPIKPVIMNDIRLVPAKMKRKKENRKKLKNEHICPYCGKLTKTLKTHILVHTSDRPFKCDKCCKGFFTKSLLNYHMGRHAEVKNFKCDQCVAAFYIKSSLKSHMLTHNEGKNHVCDICSKAFKRKCALQRHMNIHNLMPKTIKCDLCNMSFYNNYGLRHHMRVHTGERPYNCEICSQPYSYKHDFNRHCFKKHGIFLKRRSINVMNEQVLKQEKELMKNLMLRAHGILKDGEPLNPFEGPQAALAFEQAMKAIKAKQIPIELQF